MDLKKTQGRQLIPTIVESKPISVTSENLDDPKDFRREEDICQDKQALYALRNKTIRCTRCTIFEQHRAYLKCPLCPEYAICAQLKREHRIELETSPFFTIKELVWEGPRRTKTMYIAVCTDGSLRRLDNFDPKSNDGMNFDEFKDVEEVLVVTKAFQHKVIWAPVSIEQIKANHGNGGTPKEAEKLINEDGNSTSAKQRAGKRAVKAKNGKRT